MEQIEKRHERTHPAPVEAVSDGIFGSVRVWGYPCIDMSNFVALTRFTVREAIIDMNVPPHRQTGEVTHHRRLIILRGERVTSQLNIFLFKILDTPGGLCHRSMASYVF
jgi:hypothetical protein